MGRIVVGIDGSWASKAVISFALEEARLRGSSLRIVSAWKHAKGALHTYTPHGQAATREEAEQKRLERFVRGLVAGADVEVDVAAIKGDPARVLLEEAKGADVLVLGSRGRGGFSGLLLGSVSHKCSNHSPCPVVIVRPLGQWHHLMWPEI